MKIISHGPEQTREIAARLADTLKGGEVILLSGDLGAGKTTFTKGLAAALGVEETVTSPTFNYVKEYNGRLPLYHFDMYRVADADEVYELGLAGEMPEIAGIAIHRDFQGKGLGRALLCAALAELAVLGYGRCCLLVATDNRRAFSLYRRAGFRAAAVKSRWFQMIGTT